MTKGIVAERNALDLAYYALVVGCVLLFVGGALAISTDCSMQSWSEGAPPESDAPSVAVSEPGVAPQANYWSDCH